MICLVTGGAASGKSEMAERICTLLGGKVAYIATMQPFGADAQHRIARHLKLREGKGFLTVEQYIDIRAVRDVLQDRADTLLIECMSNLCANELFDSRGAGESAAETIMDGIRLLAGYYLNIVIVSNEVFSDGIQYDTDTMRYISLLGRTNCALAKLADSALEVFYGLPLLKKDTSGRIKELLEL